jgi:purine-binding chemotaxis protein CheW
MGKNNKKNAGERDEIREKVVTSSLPSCGLAEDVLGPDFFNQERISSDTKRAGKSENELFHNDGMIKYVTFFLEGEEYALPISHVQEIMRVGEITRVPNSPKHVKGVMNLRGKIIPVIELKKRLSLGEAIIDKNSRIVVVENGPKVMGLMVDKVAQVMNITAEQIDKAPDEVVQVQESYIKGVGKIDERMIILLDLEKIIVKEVKA